MFIELLGATYKKDEIKKGAVKVEDKKQTKNHFLDKEKKRLEKNNKKKKERHLFRQNKFTKGDGTVIYPEDDDIPYDRIDLIFNAKNMWANFQNPHPNYI